MCRSAARHKSAAVIWAISFLGIILVTNVALGQEARGENDDSANDVGFGLQASIFRFVQNTSVDLSRNPSDARLYTMTPGDSFELTLSYGISLSRQQPTAVIYRLQLSESYMLEIPILGEISVDGFDLLTLRSFVSTELKKVVPLQHVSLFLTEPAQFNVFVYGNVNRPGFLTANPTLRVIDAIALSGGFKADGSYRYIRLDRNNEQKSVDISRFYSNADFDSNPVLQPGDVIFIPIARRVTTVHGEVRYPGKYELVEGDTLSSVLNLAGGLKPGSETGSVDLVRQTNENRPITIRVTADRFSGFEMMNGDIVRVLSTADNLQRVAIEGAIWGRRISAANSVVAPTVPLRVDLPYYDSMSILDLLDEVGGPTPHADATRSYIIREQSESRIFVDIDALWTNRNSNLSTTLVPGDTVVIPMRLLDIFVTGAVASPGRIPYTSGYSVNDYILLAGGFDRRRASTHAIYLVDENGRRSNVDRIDVVPRGSTIHVGRKLFFFVDDTFQNIFLGAAWITSSIAVVTAVVQFLDLFWPELIP